MEIRRRNNNDKQMLIDLWRRSVEATHHFLSHDDIESIAIDIPFYLQKVPELWVAENFGNPIGFIGVDKNHIEMLFIDQLYRGKGIGTALLNHARMLYGIPIYVDVNEQNPEALGFYEHYGFHQYGRSPLDGQGRNFPILHLVCLLSL